MFFARSDENGKTNALIIFTVSAFLDLIVFQILEALVLSCIKYKSYSSKIFKKVNIFLQKLRIWKSTKPDAVL